MLLLSAVPVGACSGFDSCIVRGMRVRTPLGSRLVEELAIGDEVLAFDVARMVSVPRRLTAIARSTNREIFEIHAGEAAVLVTGSHPFWVSEKRQWTRADDLAVGDVLILLQGDSAVPASIARIAIDVREEPADVFDLTVEGPEHTFFANDLLVHNKEPVIECPVDPLTSRCAADAGEGADASDSGDSAKAD